MSKVLFSGASKFLAGVIVGGVVFSGSAIALNSYVSDNTPENGYLLCANVKTKAVTFPNKLSCPAGTKALDMGAVTGVEGPEGPQGPQGPVGPGAVSTGGKVYWGQSPSSIDIVADGSINSSSAMVRKILYTLKGSDVTPGYYKLFAHVSGLWGEGARTGSKVQCYFQSPTDYASDGGYRWGEASTERANWNGMDLNIYGDWITSSDSSMYLVCKTSGTLKGLDFQVEVTSATLAGKLP
jgi:hypothetical protein